MDKTTASVFYWMAEYLGRDRFHWLKCMDLIKDQANVTSEQIAYAMNQAADSAGFAAEITADDC